MTYDVVCYYNTGFNLYNIPSSPGVLELATKKVFPSVWKLQDKGLTEVKLQASWEDIRNVDYVKIGDGCYTVQNIAMSNGVAILTLRQDSINTAGGTAGFNIVDGWIERAHSSTDGLFTNILDEPWVPREILKLDGPYQITDVYRTSIGNTYIGASVTLEDIPTVALEFTNAASDPVVAVPSIPAVVNGTSCKLFSDKEYDPEQPPIPENWFKDMEQVLPNMRLYLLGKAYNYVHQGVAFVRALGLTDTITASYIVPDYYARPYVETVEDTGVDVLASRLKLLPASQLPFEYGTYKPKNKKVFSMYNTYNVISTATSDKGVYEGRNIYNKKSSPEFYVYCDPSPEGKPYCQPSYYESSPTMLFQNSISGATWFSSPFKFSMAEGLSQKSVQYNRDRFDYLVEGTIKPIRAGIEVSENLGEMNLGGALRAASEMPLADFTRKENWNRKMFDEVSSMTIVSPEILFGRGAAMQGYVGNGFMCYRTRLSDSDIEHFDNFLTMYGYADSRPLKRSDLTSRKYFNYIKANNITVSGFDSLWIRNSIADQLTGGVRLWHVLPNAEAMKNNPIK